MKPSEYIRIIDNQYHRFKKTKTSRLSIEWGKWSRDMNLETRSLIESPASDPHTVMLLKYVFTYWMLRSQLLELYHKSSILKLGKRKKLVSECNEMKEMILKEESQPGSGGLPDLTKQGFTDMVTDKIL